MLPFVVASIDALPGIEQQLLVFGRGDVLAAIGPGPLQGVSSVGLGIHPSDRRICNSGCPTLASPYHAA